MTEYGPELSTPTYTFQRIPTIGRSERESDDGSVIDDEQKQVGINNHLSKAIALLSDEGQASSNYNTSLEQSWALLSQTTNATTTNTTRT
jgi:hypothetical protein